MSTIGNILWFVLGGFFMGLGWWLAGLLCAITIVGLPWAKACFVIGQFAFLPFGKEAVSRAVVSGVEDIGTGVLGTIGNVLWFIFAGVWLALGHLASALCCFVTHVETKSPPCPSDCAARPEFKCGGADGDYRTPSHFQIIL